MFTFLSTPSARRATRPRSVLPLWFFDFYPRPLRGGRPQAAREENRAKTFLSTPSARRATHPAGCGCKRPVISIHALCEEGDQSAHADTLNLGRFLSTPSARRATHVCWLRHVLVPISIHALCEEGDPFQCRSQMLFFDFYPRPLRGGRLFASTLFPEGVVFLSTPSARRATGESCHRGCRRDISIHALCEEGDA